MTRGSLAAAVICVVLALSPAPPPSEAAFGWAGPPRAYPLPVRLSAPRVDEDLELVVLNLINEERLAAGVAPLMPHATLQRAARAHGRDLFARGALSHFSSDGRTPRERVLDLGARVRLVGENLAYAASALDAHYALVASPEHRANMLLPQYRLVGVAVLGGGDDGVVLVEDYSDEGNDPLGGWWMRASAGRRP
jgi:uncharacterized protein YkwD